ncbi:MAG: hexitol phosphatase HxpB [Chitinophagaceae bacterium]|nr:hexitol phosphatase HxpB [Chitinophagaceae bacterium]MCW5927597.1 hexitol phosphatase HxpB [Chitinophagaceae bacterium]
MTTDTFIFDMDGLLIDSEPLWEEAGCEVLKEFGVELTNEQYHSSTGLRTEEWITHWFNHFNIPLQHAPGAITSIIDKATFKIEETGIAMPGVYETLDLLRYGGFTLGIATSSPLSLVDVVVNKLEIAGYFKVFTSADRLAYGKPHPEVYLNCAARLGKHPAQCACFEDSYNGMISVKAARMKCIVVPAPAFREEHKWKAADMQLKSLLDFNKETLGRITGN